MAITAVPYGNTFLGQYSATAARQIIWASDTIQCGLATSSYTPNRDTHVYYSDITNEVVGTGYTAKGVTLGSMSSSYDSGSHQARFFSGTAQWTTATT